MPARSKPINSNSTQFWFEFLRAASRFTPHFTVKLKQSHRRSLVLKHRSHIHNSDNSKRRHVKGDLYCAFKADLSRGLSLADRKWSELQCLQRQICRAELNSSEISPPKEPLFDPFKRYLHYWN